MKFRDIPIQRKLMTVILSTSGAVLLLTCTAFFAYEFFIFKSEAGNQLSTLGKVIATNSTAALAFDDAETAAEVLGALKAEKHIVAAALYNAEGKLFSQFPDDAVIAGISIPASPGKDGYEIANSYLEGYQPVIQGEKRLGTLYIKSNMGAMYERLRLYSGIAIIVMRKLAKLVAIATARTGRDFNRKLWSENAYCSLALSFSF